MCTKISDEAKPTVFDTGGVATGCIAPAAATGVVHPAGSARRFRSGEQVAFDATRGSTEDAVSRETEGTG